VFKSTRSPKYASCPPLSDSTRNLSICNVSRLAFGGLEAEVSIVENTMVTMER
jgi:hypothetical protein